MKKIFKNIQRLLFFSVIFISCEDFLEEEPLDFSSSVNSFETMSDFESTLADVYARYRELHYSRAGDNRYAFAHLYGTDIMKDARETDDFRRFGNYGTVLTSVSDVPQWHWDRWFKVVSQANTIINRSNDAELEEIDRTLVQAEALLFRALAYRYLVYLWGDVPLLLEEVVTVRNDLVREDCNVVLLQIAEDAEFAAQNLPAISEVEDGRLSNLVAYHLLAETYISLERWNDAITAASAVIDDANTSLMTDRFGTRATEEPGDVYWDLFRAGNQNRSSGNREAIWVAQMEVDVLGGLLTSGGNGENGLERLHSPVSWTLTDPDGTLAMLGPRSDTNVGGRGVSFMRPTDHFENTIWESDFDNDIRNANHNYSRTITYDNPESNFFGMSAIDPASLSPRIAAQDWRWYPYLTKVTTPGNHPTELYSDNDLQLLANTAGSTYRDQYYIRLAETYLLRAEAYLGSGNTTSAADDINAVRARSNAGPVAPGEVTIDYILDERARKLSLEEQRRITLHRVGRLIERVRLYNDHNDDDIQGFHNLWPIPLNDIQANTQAELAQNRCYE